MCFARTKKGHESVSNISNWSRSQCRKSGQWDGRCDGTRGDTNGAGSQRRKQPEKRISAKVLEREIDELRLDRMIPGSPAQDGMPHGSGGGDLSGYAARLDELDRSLHAQLERKLRIRKEITDKIDAISDETEGLILRMKYIHGLSFGKIAEKTGYSRRHTIRLHGQALENFKL